MPFLPAEMEIEATPANLLPVQSFVEAYLEKMGCPMKTQMQISVAVEEIFVNIAFYSYAPETGRATVRVAASEAADSVTVTFLDSGRPYDPLSRADPDVTAPAETRTGGGLGVYMTKKLMDNVTYAYRDGRNVLTLKKNL